MELALYYSVIYHFSIFFSKMFIVFPKKLIDYQNDINRWKEIIKPIQLYCNTK